MTKRVRELSVVICVVLGLFGLRRDVVASERATLMVTKSADTNDGICDSDCSLREAFAVANANFDHDTIDLTGVGDSFFALPLGTIFVESEVTLNCGLPTLPKTLGGENSHRILFVGAGAKLTLNACSLLSGNAVDDGNPSTDDYGGAIFNAGELVMSHGNVSHSSADQHGGAIFSRGPMTLHDVIFSRNMAGAQGGAIYSEGDLTIQQSELYLNEAGRDGGAIVSTQAFTMTRSLVDQNTSIGRGGGIWIDGGSGTIVQSAITANRAREDNGQSISGQGGGIYSNGDLTIENTTISSNLASHSSVLQTGNGGGVYAADGNLQLHHVTLAANYAPNLGHTLYVADGATVTTTNSIFATTDVVTGLNCHIETFDSLVVAGQNVADDGSCTGIATGDPNLGTLAQNGDSITYSHALNDPSDALNSADSAHCPAADQRNYGRSNGTGCDVGALEMAGLPLAVTLREAGVTTTSVVLPAIIIALVFGTLEGLRTKFLEGT